MRESSWRKKDEREREGGKENESGEHGTGGWTADQRARQVHETAGCAALRLAS
jgi:hypothetical protein